MQDDIRDAESLATLMSLHNAKGLEYEIVFVIGCEEGVFPHSRSLEEGNVEEERRLAYVGVTRARERLWMTHARRRSLHGGAMWNVPSRFLAELPSALVEHHVATTPTGWSSGGSDARQRATGFGQRPASMPSGGGFSAPAPKQAAPPPVPYPVVTTLSTPASARAWSPRSRPASVVVVRFAGDGAERKLMADYAPLQKVRSSDRDGSSTARRLPPRSANGWLLGSPSSLPPTTGMSPGLATVLVGDDPASHVYVGNKRKLTEEVGMRSIHHGLAAETPDRRAPRAGPGSTPTTRSTGSSSSCPSPSRRPGRIVSAIALEKDVDGLTAVSAGSARPGPSGPGALHAAGRDRADRRGGDRDRGRRGGRPGALDSGRPAAGGPADERQRDRHRLPLAHARSGGACARARPSSIAAVGSPALVGADMVKPGATVIDVGTNRTDDGLVGDVDFAPVAEVAGAMTPVPGGVGPMTIAMLLANTLRAATERPH